MQGEGEIERGKKIYGNTNTVGPLLCNQRGTQYRGVFKYRLGPVRLVAQGAHTMPRDVKMHLAMRQSRKGGG